jgi:hypothetical protein
VFLKNTSRYPDDQVRRLLDYASEGFDLRRIAVHLKNSKHAYAGMAYEKVPRIANAASSAKHLVTLRIGPPDKFPVDNVRRTIRWVDLPYEDIPDRGFVEDVLGIPYDTPEYNAWWREHRIWTCYRCGVQVTRVQRMVREQHPYGGKGSPLIEMRDWREGLVGLAAHEFCHIYQFQNNLPRSEVQAERASAKRLETYRASVGALAT